MRLLKNIAKSIIRRSVAVRLQHLPLSLETAEWYADQIKKWPAIFNGLKHQCRCLLPFGVEMELGIVDHIERTLRTTGAWDPVIERTLQACLKPSDVFLDVGANIGYFSLLGSQLVGPSGHVVSFEPSVRALSKLTKHLYVNGCSNVTVCSQAMGEKSGIEILNWASDSNIGGSTIARGTPSGGHHEKVIVRRLDDVCNEMQLVPSMIKMDVEGFELYALRGAQETLKRHHPIVVCELTHTFLQDHGQSGEELMLFMHQLGYDAWVIGLDDAGQVTAQPIGKDNTPRKQAELIFAVEMPPLAAAAKAGTLGGHVPMMAGPAVTH